MYAPAPIKALKQKAHIAGLLYLAIILCGIFSEAFVRSLLIVDNNASATAANIMQSEFLFRLGMASDLIMVVSDVGVALLFYMLLREVNKDLALLAAFFRLAQASLIGMNLLNYFIPILLLNDYVYLTPFSEEQIHSLMMLFLQAYTYGYLVSGIFFGFSCLILSHLLYYSPYFPKVLAWLVGAASVTYLVNSFSYFLWPGLAHFTDVMVFVIAVLAEFSLCLWLLIKGIRQPKTNNMQYKV